jgi:hypothetical protein
MRTPRTFSLALALSMVLLCVSRGVSAQQVSIDTGAVEGKSDGGVRIFIGIPEAAPPVGDLRDRYLFLNSVAAK